MIKILTIIKEHRHFGKQIFKLSKTELVKQYKGAAIGPFWALIKPSFTLFVYWFAFTVGIKNMGIVDISLANGSVMHFDRFIFMLTGFVPWWFVSESITQGAKSIRANRQFVTKVKFPVSTILTYTSLSRVYIHFLLCGIMMLILGIYDVCFGTQFISLYALQFFILCPIMFFFFLALSWSTAPMCAFSKDLESMITSIMSGIFWLTGVIYSSYDLPPTNMQTLLEFVIHIARHFSITSHSGQAMFLTQQALALTGKLLFSHLNSCSYFTLVYANTTVCERHFLMFCKE